MIEVSILTKEDEKDYDKKKPVIKGVENTEIAIKLLPPVIKNCFDAWKKCKEYNANNNLESMHIEFKDFRYCFNDWYWD